MALDSAEEDHHREEEQPAHHPSAPNDGDDELFDVSTTVDPSYIISLIRKLVPPKVTSRTCSSEDALTQQSKGIDIEATRLSSFENGIPKLLNDGTEPMDAQDDSNNLACERGGNEGAPQLVEDSNEKLGDQAWEECGCILWDLAANRRHAEFMVQNLLLEVISANLMVTDSVRIKEISLGIIGNCACHEVPMKQIVSLNGLIEIILDQLFINDTPCLTEAFRLITMGLQGNECVKWAEVMQSEHILSRLLWIAENTLSAQLLEKSIGLLLAIIESQVAPDLLVTMMKLGLADLLRNLLSFEIRKFMTERIPERYGALDFIFRATESLSTIDAYSEEICSNEEIVEIIIQFVRIPDKAEVASCAVTAAVLIANILSDTADLASNLSRGNQLYLIILNLPWHFRVTCPAVPDFAFIQGLLNILPFSSDDFEASSAIWSILARLLVWVEECKISLLSLHQYVLVFSEKSELIEDDLLNHQSGYCDEDQDDNSRIKLQARNIALRRIVSIANHWDSSKNEATGNGIGGEDRADELNTKRLLDCCSKHIK